MPQVATRITYVELDDDRQIESGESIRVHNILVTNIGLGASQTVDFKKGNGTGDVILRIQVLNNESKEFEGIWIAKDGLWVDSVGDSRITVSIIHSAGGV